MGFDVLVDFFDNCSSFICVYLGKFVYVIGIEFEGDDGVVVFVLGFGYDVGDGVVFG